MKRFRGRNRKSRNHPTHRTSSIVKGMTRPRRRSHRIARIHHYPFAIDPALKLAFEHDLSLLSTTRVIVMRHTVSRLVIQIANMQTRMPKISTRNRKPRTPRIPIHSLLLTPTNNQFFSIFLLQPKTAQTVILNSFSGSITHPSQLFSPLPDGRG